MVLLSVFIFLIVFESSKVLSNAFNTYCTLPCPFTGPPQPPSSCGAIQLPPRRQRPMARSSFYDAYTDYEDIPEESQPPPNVRLRQQPAKPNPPPPKSKPKPPSEDSEPPPKKRDSSPPSSPSSSPSIQPSRRFFTSLFSIPGAVVDTLIGGEVTL